MPSSSGTDKVDDKSKKRVYNFRQRPQAEVGNTSDNPLSNAVQSVMKRNETSAKKSTKAKPQPKDKESPVIDKAGRSDVVPLPVGVVSPIEPTNRSIEVLSDSEELAAASKRSHTNTDLPIKKRIEEIRKEPSSCSQEAQDGDLQLDPPGLPSPSQPSVEQEGNNKAKRGRRKKGKSSQKDFFEVPKGIDKSTLRVFLPESQIGPKLVGKTVPWEAFTNLNQQLCAQVAPPKGGPQKNGRILCLKCGIWFGSHHGESTCKNNRPSTGSGLEYKFPPELEKDAIRYEAISKKSKMCTSFDSLNISVEEFQDADQWDLSLFKSLDPLKMFSSPGTLHKTDYAFRLSFSELVYDIIKLVLEGKEGAIDALFVLPRLILPNGVRGRILVNRVFRNISAFRIGKFQELWDRPNIVLRYGSFDPEQKAVALAYAGEPSEAVKALSSKGVLDPNDCYEKLVDLHPRESFELDLEYLEPDYSNPPCTPEDLKLAIRKAKWRKAADALGWRMDMVKNLSAKTTNLLCDLCMKILADPGTIPERLRPYFFGARLIPLPKKEKGDVRPIAIGTIFHKIISSAIMFNVKSDLIDFFAPVQFGVGIPGGAENVIHGVRTHLFYHPEFVLVSLDLKNAFNSVRRTAFIDQLKAHFPNLLGWVIQVYGSPSWLTVRGKDPIASEAGVRQGDPMGPFLFCLAIQPILIEISELVESFTYMDDIYLVGEPMKMCKALTALETYLSSINLQINFKKSWVNKKTPGISTDFPDNMVSGRKTALSQRLTVNDDPKVMKVPLYCDNNITELNAKVAESINAISNIRDVQVALILLRQIHNGSLTYTLRTAHNETTKRLINDFRGRVINALANLLRCTVEDVEKISARVFMPLGPGLGFAPLKEIAPLAYQASLMRTLHCLNSIDKERFPMPKPNKDSQNRVEQGIFAALAHEELLNSDPTLRLQHLLVEQTNSARFKKAVKSLSNLQKTIINSTHDTHANGWLSAYPTVPELRIQPDKMVIALRLFLNIPFYEDVYSCNSCGAKIDDYNQHALICNASSGNSHRHTEIVNCVKSLCNAADLSWQLEVNPFELHKIFDAKDFRRVDVVAFAHGPHRKDVGYDISVTNPFIKSAEGNPCPLAAAKIRENEKIKKYGESCEKNNMEFHPLVFDAYGGIPSRTLNQAIRPLIWKVKEYVPVNWAAPTAETYWLQRFSVALWTANAYKVKFRSGIV